MNNPHLSFYETVETDSSKIISLEGKIKKNHTGEREKTLSLIANHLLKIDLKLNELKKDRDVLMESMKEVIKMQGNILKFVQNKMEY